VAWLQFGLVVVVLWLVTAIFVGAMVGQALTLGQPDNS
jgi:hypothetical protein